MLDCNNFYASCERLLHPELRDAPIAVLSSNDGCIIARSNEVKALGVPMGAPLHLWRDVLKQHGVHFFSANFTFYADVSARIIKLIRARVPAVEVYSIDEAFLDFAGMERFYNLKAFSYTLREEILQDTGIPVSIGIAPTKVLAKVANRLAKDRKTYVEQLLTLEEQQAVLQNMPAHKVWGVGRRNAEHLQRLGIRTAWDLRNADPVLLRKLRSVVEERLVLELRGIPCISLQQMSKPKKHIATTRSFGTPVTDYESLRQAVAFYTANAAIKLRQQGSAAGALQVYIRTNPFSKVDARYHNETYIDLPAPTCYTPDLVHHAVDALREIYAPGYRYAKAGVVLLRIVPWDQLQHTLFDLSIQPPARQLRAMRTVDTLNAKYGKGKLAWGVSHKGEAYEWMAKAEFKSTPIDMDVTDEDRARTKPWW